MFSRVLAVRITRMHSWRSGPRTISRPMVFMILFVNICQCHVPCCSAKSRHPTELPPREAVVAHGVRRLRHPSCHRTPRVLLSRSLEPPSLHPVCSSSHFPGILSLSLSFVEYLTTTASRQTFFCRRVEKPVTALPLPLHCLDPAGLTLFFFRHGGLV